MVILCWAAKGGSGTTVVAAALALNSERHALLVDLDGELPAALGLPDPDRPGIADWLASDAPPAHLDDLTIAVTPRVSLLPYRQLSPPGGRSAVLATAASTARLDDRWRVLAEWFGERVTADIDVIIDAGTGEPHPALVALAEHRMLVTRPCYLSLRRAARASTRPTGVIVVDEPGHSLSVRDVERTIGEPVVAVVSFDPAIARAVDAGLLTTRLPGVIVRQLRRVAA
jgi:MinD-like ATPase involved in chromosome partitioning or flagellar assembly